MIKAFIERVLPRKKPVRVEHSGKALGIHSEHMGYLLAELQYMQRAYPNMTW